MKRRVGAVEHRESGQHVWGKWSKCILGGTWKTTAHPTGLSLDVNNTMRQSMTLCAAASWWGGSRVPYVLWTYEKLDCHFSKNHGSLSYFGHAFSKTSPFSCIQRNASLVYAWRFINVSLHFAAIFLPPTWLLNKIQPPWSKWYNFTRPWDTKVTAKCEAHVQLAPRCVKSHETCCPSHVSNLQKPTFWTRNKWPSSKQYEIWGLEV